MTITQLVFPEDLSYLPELKTLLDDFQRVEDVASGLESARQISQHLDANRLRLQNTLLTQLLDHLVSLPPPSSGELDQLTELVSKLNNDRPAIPKIGARHMNKACLVNQSAPWIKILSESYPDEMMIQLLMSEKEFDAWLESPNPNTTRETYKTMAQVIVKGYMSPHYRGTDTKVVIALGKISQAYPEAIRSSCPPEFFARLTQRTLNSKDDSLALGLAAIRRARLSEIFSAPSEADIAKNKPAF